MDAGFQPIDARTTIDCPSTSTTTTCTIEADQHLQVDGSTTANKWGTCTTVDGAFMAEPNCPLLGVVPSDGTFTSGSFVQTKTRVSVGNHTVRSFLYTSFGRTREIYEFTHRVYVP